MNERSAILRSAILLVLVLGTALYGAAGLAAAYRDVRAAKAAQNTGQQNQAATPALPPARYVAPQPITVPFY